MLLIHRGAVTKWENEEFKMFIRYFKFSKNLKIYFVLKILLAFAAFNPWNGGVETALAEGKRFYFRTLFGFSEPSVTSEVIEEIEIPPPEKFYIEGQTQMISGYCSLDDVKEALVALGRTNPFSPDEVKIIEYMSKYDLNIMQAQFRFACDFFREQGVSDLSGVFEDLQYCSDGKCDGIRYADDQLHGWLKKQRKKRNPIVNVVDTHPRGWEMLELVRAACYHNNC